MVKIEVLKTIKELMSGKNNPSEIRPSPEALLKELHAESKGHLKIFLGASPGVGKTYSMLQAAHALKLEGIDVVVGIVETHKRSETEAQLKELEVIPTRTITYRNIEFKELDLDALLARKPQLALIDELAHTNIPGSRHPKRYLDVEELLDNGIDVYSTLNIQHVESLNDVVSRISKVQVRETVPDSILEIAEDIELIDLPPKALQKRLQEGKVYIPDQAKQAQNHFFSQGNLTALRELALRYTAESVDRQLLTYMKSQGLEGNFPTRDRLMVCIGDDYGGLELVRNCHRMAERQKASWAAVHVHIPGEDKESDYLSQSLKLAEELGAEVITLNGNEVAEELLSFIRERNVTRIIVGRSKVKWWKIQSHTTAGKLLSSNDTFETVVIPTEDRVLLERQVKPEKKEINIRISHYIRATLAVLISAGAAYTIKNFFNIPNLSLVFLSAVLFSAARYGLMPALYSIALSLFIYISYFTGPHFSFTNIAYNEYALTLTFFIAVAIVTSHLTARIRKQINMMHINSRRIETLYEFNRKIAEARDLQSVLRAVVTHVTETLGGRASILLPDEEVLKIAAGYPELDEVSIGAAHWAWRHGEAAGRSCNTLPASPWMFVPMRTDSSEIGVLGLYFLDNDKLVSQEEKRLLYTLSHQAAVAIERTQLSENIDEARIYTETERFRTALLSSISHDFRTPLASIMGSVSSMQNYDKTLDDKTKRELLETIHGEADRLNRFIQNLVDITRHGEGTLEPLKDWVDVHDIFNASIIRLKNTLQHRTTSIIIAPDMPLLFVDRVLLEQVMVNLIDNACKNSPPKSVVTLSSFVDNHEIVLQCMDEGKGIPPDKRVNLFNMFYGNRPEDRQSAGTGIGLAICKGIIESHGGTIIADEGKDRRGTMIVIRLPLVEKQAVVPEVQGKMI